MATTIDLEVDNCNDLDIEVEVFRFGAGVPQTTERQRLTDYVLVPTTAGTYTKSVDFDSLNGPTKYIVFLYTEEDGWTGSVSMSYTDGVTTITPTETVNQRSSWFNTADGRVFMGYYIGSDIPRSGTIRCTRDSNGLQQGTFRVWVGNAFGHVTKVFMEAYSNIAVWGYYGGAGTTPREVTIAPAHWAWGFGGAGGTAHEGSGQYDASLGTKGMQVFYTSGPNVSSYEHHCRPSAIDGPVYTGTFKFGMYGKGAGAQILLQDDANVGESLSLNAGDIVEFDVEVGHCTDIEIVIENGACSEGEPET